MRSHIGVFVENLVFTALCLSTGPVFLVLGGAAWHDGASWGWAVSACGAAVTVMIPVLALRSTRAEFPRITGGNRVRDGSGSYGDDTFVMWAPRSEPGPAGARLVRADVLEASSVRYDPDREATFTTYVGDYAPAEFTPLVRLRLRVHAAEEAEGAVTLPGFEITDEWRVPALCLSAITAGRLAVLTDGLGNVTVHWPGSALLAGTRTCRLIDHDGRLIDVTRRTRHLLAQMRLSRTVGGIEMAGDTIDLRHLDTETAARFRMLADRVRAFPEDRAPVTEPGEEARLMQAQLPGDEGGVGSVGRRWSRRGGHLVRARFLEMRARTTFQYDGPVLDTVLRAQPADGTPPFDAARRLTVPMNYLAVLHHTREAVLSVSPNGRSFVVDWDRTNLLAGVGTAKVIAPDGREILVPRRSDALWPLMNLLASHAVSNPTPVLDLRAHRMRAVAGAVMEVMRDRGLAPTDHRT
ncbi:hypothetical protein [Streptomyces lasiicapitis]|uniref:Uncharacterized protein n=1 Tax=Streptomyces lasiicapitis TaxID=1923961 RepID=A0ABQ2MUW8_9ACTN|nr:hypothetical protein [Streptomyces lasiicapitis]GGO59242.1 hypothetical protein GCM10012286_80390 [Streptomyces lasiicapitis]